MLAYKVCSQVSGVRYPAGSSIHGALRCKCLKGYQVYMPSVMGQRD